MSEQIMIYTTFNIKPKAMIFNKSIVKFLMCFIVASYGFSQTLERTIVSDIPTDEVVYFESSENTNRIATTITAGTDELLTLVGSDFGEPFEVYFRNANYGGSAFSKAYQIESWTYNEIIVRVPSFAGSGEVRVLKADSTQLQFENIIIPYALINGRYQNTESRVSHVDEYVLNLNLPEPARSVFVEAIEVVKCETKMNIIVGDDTTQTTNANDGVNLVMFSNDLPTFTLAATYNRFVGCINNGQVDWYLKEFDILINENFNWNYDDTITSDEFDFLKVMIHELLHASMMGHVIDETDIMHFSTANGTMNRTLNQNNLDGRVDQQSYSTTYEVCGQPIFTDADCNTLSSEGINEGINEGVKPYKVEYFNISGQKINKPTKGITFIKEYYENAIKTRKIVK